MANGKLSNKFFHCTIVIIDAVVGNSNIREIVERKVKKDLTKSLGNILRIVIQSFEQNFS